MPSHIEWCLMRFNRSIRNIGIMCTVDLFPVPESLLSSDSSSSASQYYPRASTSIGADPRSAAPLTYFPLHPYTTLDAHGEEATTASFHIPRRQPLLRHLNVNEAPKDVVFRLGNHLVTESSKLTPALVGEKFVEPTLVEHKGKKALVFVFGVTNLFQYDQELGSDIMGPRILPYSARAPSYCAIV